MVWTYSNELVHHGILGMKWGRRNGPPYPLGAGDHSASEVKAGWKKSLSGINKKRLKSAIITVRKTTDNGRRKVDGILEKKDKLNNAYNAVKSIVDKYKPSDEQITLIKIGASIVGTVLAAYGSYKLSSSPEFRGMVLKGMDVLSNEPSIDDLLNTAGPTIVRR